MTELAVNENELGTPVEADPPEEKTPERLELEARARRMGWRDKSEFDRPPSRWVDADVYVERGETELPVLRERYRQLDTKFAKIENQLQEVPALKQTITDQAAVMNELRDLAKNAEDRAYVRALRELAERERQAVAEADTSAYDRVQAERRDLEAARTPTAAPPVRPAPVGPTPAPAAPPVSNPEVDAWVQQNRWFINDPVLNGVALAFDRQIKNDNPDWTVAEQLAEVRRMVVERFPEKFDNPRRSAPVAVATPTAPAPRSKKKTLRDMPKEYQDAFARFKRMMPDYTEEEYLKSVGEM